MDQTLFADLPVVDPEKDYSEELLGEDKKFKTTKDLARGKVEADLMIERMKREQDALRQELAQKTSLDQVMDRLSQLTTPADTPPSRPSTDQDPPEERQALDINELINKTLDQRDKTRQEQDNLRQARDMLVKNFGQNFVPEVESRAAQLGLGKSFLDDLAKTQPKAFAAILGLQDNPESVFTPPNGTRRPSFDAKNVKDFQYYENLRKSDSRNYYSAAIQNEMFKSFQEQGEDVFYGRLKP